MRVVVNTKERKEAFHDLYGIFFEDINHAADGGLYAELVQNRSFEFSSIDHPSYHALTAWEVVCTNGQATATVMSGGAVSEKNPHYLVLDVQEEGDDVGIQNTGYNTGIPLKAGAEYYFTCYGKREQDLEKPIKVSLRSADGEIYTEQKVLFGLDWEKVELTFTAPREDYAGRLALTVEGRGKVYLDFVSLFPADTYKGRRNGLRKDLAEMLANLHPKFMRFPGGCLVHDGALDAGARDAQYRWKNTVGKPHERPARRNNWRYNQTLGLGYFEYFQFCEDIGAQPLPVIPAGYDPHHRRCAPLDQMQQFIDEALDLIEFANGDEHTKWGAVRAAMGHPEPFSLKYLGIGNEEVGEEFFERSDIIQACVREKYPEIQLINTAGPFCSGGEYERGWENARKVKSDLVDEHYYMAPEWFVANHHRYDDFDPNGPKVFLGEYATWGNTWYNALIEASYMTGLERNAAKVGLACYAPLFANADYVNWQPDLIWFDNHRVYGSANYYVQKLFMENQGEYRLDATLENAPEPVLYYGKGGNITGDILLSGYESDIAYSKIVYTDLETGEEIPFEDCVTTKENRRIPLLHTDSGHYTLELDAVELEGYRGLHVIFGSENEQNEFVWTVGGWQNQDNILNQRMNGRGADISQYAFSLERGRSYHLKVEVEGRKIRLWVDGKLWHDTESKLPMAKPLYVSAAEDKDGLEKIVKLVNILDTDREVEIVLDGCAEGEYAVEQWQMSGYELDDKNSFDEPTKVAPVYSKSMETLPVFKKVVPARSVTVLKVKM